MMSCIATLYLTVDRDMLMRVLEDHDAKVPAYMLPDFTVATNLFRENLAAFRATPLGGKNETAMDRIASASEQSRKDQQIRWFERDLAFFEAAIAGNLAYGFTKPTMHAPSRKALLIRTNAVTA